jgi:hypothetical protein
MINPHTQNQGQRGKNEKWNSQNLIRAGLVFVLLYCVSSIGLAYSAEVSGKTQTGQRPPTLLKLSLDGSVFETKLGASHWKVWH